MNQTRHVLFLVLKIQNPNPGDAQLSVIFQLSVATDAQLSVVTDT